MFTYQSYHAGDAVLFSVGGSRVWYGEKFHGAVLQHNAGAMAGCSRDRPTRDEMKLLLLPSRIPMSKPKLAFFTAMTTNGRCSSSPITEQNFSIFASISAFLYRAA